MTLTATSVDNTVVLDLTDNQRAIWYDQAARGQCPVYNIGGRLAIFGAVDHVLLSEALVQLVKQNLAMRLVFVNNGDGVRQCVQGDLKVDLPFLDLSKEPNPAKAAEQWLQVQFSQAFSLDEHNPCWHFALLRVSEQQHILLTKYHHLIADGWSTKIVIDRLAELYNALSQGRTYTPSETTTFADYVAQEAQYLQSAQCFRDAEFWQEKLPTLPEPLFNAKYTGAKELQTSRACHHRFELDRVFYASLQAWADSQKASIYHVLLAALTVYFARTHQRNRIITGLPVLNRGGARFKKVVGMFASLSPLVIEVDSNTSVSAFLRQIANAVRHVHKHQRYPLGALHQRLQLLKNKRERLFDWVLSFERQEYNVRFGDASVEAQQLFNGFALYPLAVTVCEFDANSAVEVILEGSETFFTQSELTWLAGRFHWILQQFIASPDALVREIDLVPNVEKDFIFNVFNTPEQTPQFTCIVSQFKYWVEQTPDAIAVSVSTSSLSYRQLDDFSTQVAYYLQRQCQVDAGQLVAVCMPRCIEAIVGMLAILKIRAVYVPLDCESPFERLQRLVQQNRFSALLSLAAQIHLKGLHEKQLCVDTLEPIGLFDRVSLVDPQPDDLVYVIFTSGSSGEPKGVMIDYRAMSVRLAWLQSAFRCGPGARVGQTIQTHFDPSLIEIFVALTQGAQLVLAETTRLSAHEFAEFVVGRKINFLALVPSSLQLLLQGLSNEGALSLQAACCGGEVLPAKLAGDFVTRTGARLFNVYGPTETTILASVWSCDADTVEILPIGRPLPHTQILIVDRDMQLLPLGVPGEIVIGGLGVGRGYWLKDELTLLAFLPNTYSTRVDSKLYRTGDYGYIGADGQLYFLERLDRQVKISGYRIELAEIEQVLMQHSSVSRAAVKLILQDGAKWMAAYVETVSRNEQALKADLTTYMRCRLPYYMQPRELLIMLELPLTACGKIDYVALPEPKLSYSKHPARAPASDLEVQLLAIWQKTLKNSVLTVDDNFFAQDTDSLTAVSLLLALEKLTGCRQSIAFLMAYPSVAEQAAYLEKASKEDLLSSAVVLPQSTKVLVSEGIDFSFSQVPHYPAVCSQMDLERRQGSRTDLFLAASGYGDQLRFHSLAQALADRCDLHVLYPSEIDDPQASIEQIAAEYAAIISQRAEQPYFIAGFSIGGITAMEAARQLERQGLPPEGVILLDTVYPHWPLQSIWLFNALRWLSGLWLLNRISMNGRKLQAMLTDPGITLQLAALNRHAIRPYSGLTLLVMTQKMRWLQSRLFQGWRQLLGDGLIVERMPGLHGAMFRQPYLGVLVEIIHRGLNRK